MREDTIKKNFAKRLKQARSDAGFSQSQAAAKLGFFATELSKYENSHAQPSLVRLRKFCKVYGVSADSLLSLA